MNPLEAIRNLLTDVASTYGEGVRRKEFGHDYLQKEEATRLDIENARARAAEFKLNAGRESEMHGVRMTAAQRAAEQADLERATAIAEATKHGHAGDLSGIADHTSEQNLQEGKLKVDRESARIAADEARRESYKGKPALDTLRAGLLRAQTFAAQSRASTGQQKGALEIQRLNQQLEGKYNPDVNAPDARTTRPTSLRPSSSDLREMAAIEVEREGGDPDDQEEVMAKMTELFDRAQQGVSKRDAPVESGSPQPSVTQAPKLVPSQSRGGTPPPGAKTATDKNGNKVWWNGSAWIPVN